MNPDDPEYTSPGDEETVEIPDELKGRLAWKGVSTVDGRPLTEVRAELVKLLYTSRGLRPVDLAGLFRTSTASVHADLTSDMGGPPVQRRGPVPAFTPEQAEEILTAVRAGVTYRELAERYGTTSGNLAAWVYRQRKTRDDVPIRPRWRITPEQREEILAARREGVPIRELAERYGTTEGSLGSWLCEQRKVRDDVPTGSRRKGAASKGSSR